MSGASARAELLPEVQRFLGRRLRLLIGADWVEARSGDWLTTYDPSRAEPLAGFAEAGPAEVELAVVAARRAFESPAWRDLVAAERARLLFGLADLVDEHREELAQLEALDTGKPVAEARAVDVTHAAEHFRYFAGWVTKIHGATIPSSAGSFHLFTRREPVGVCGLIVPWNYPLLLSSWKLAPALACGNTVLLKPAEETPLTAVRLGELVLEAGFPPGVVNVLTGRGETTGAAIVRHIGVDKISFTGSTEVGRTIAAAAAAGLKRVSLELGGKSASIVFPDADLERASAGSGWGVFYNSGEDCTAASRLLVHEAVYDEVVERVSRLARSIRIGDPFDGDSQIGPLITGSHRERVEAYIAHGRGEGAEVVAGGARPEGLGEGFFFEPTVLAGAGNGMRVAAEEIFGPVVAVIPFRDEEEAVGLANASSYGLGAGIWTNDLRRAHRVAQRVRAGTVWVNDYGKQDAAAPFGGFKASGYGREHGSEALDAYLESKSVWISLE